MEKFFLTVLMAIFTNPAVAGPLHEAARNVNLAEVRQLLNEGADPNGANEASYSPLHSLMGRYETHLDRDPVGVRGSEGHAHGLLDDALENSVMESPSLEVIQLLLIHGANPNSTTHDGETPLHFAANFEENFEAIQLMLNHDALVDYPNLHGYTPLFVAVNAGHARLAQLLLDHGANVNQVNDHGTTPIYWAALSGSIEVVRLLVERGADIHAVDPHGWTALHAAASNSDFEMAGVLIEYGLGLEWATTSREFLNLYPAVQDRLRNAQLTHSYILK